MPEYRPLFPAATESSSGRHRRPELFVNKVGTAAICALARSEGIPVYVLAGREKLLSGPDIDRLEIVSGPPAQVVDPRASRPSSVQSVILSGSLSPLATLVVTDAGVRSAQSGPGIP